MLVSQALSVSTFLFLSLIFNISFSNSSNSIVILYKIPRFARNDREGEIIL